MTVRTFIWFLESFWANLITYQDHSLSPTDKSWIFYYIGVDLGITWGDSYWSWSIRISSIQFHNNPDFPLLVKHLILWWIYIWWSELWSKRQRVGTWTRMGVVLLEYLIFTILFSLQYGYLSLLMVLSSGGIMFCGVLFLLWCVLVLGKNWWCVGFLHTQLRGIFKALDIYVYNSWWLRF